MPCVPLQCFNMSNLSNDSCDIFRINRNAVDANKDNKSLNFDIVFCEYMYINLCVMFSPTR